jgi:deferrochelatase/peroxidase EfeB
MFGRYPNGNIVTPNSSINDPVLETNEINNFFYKENDPHGYGCPIGSHIRKANPRDGIDDDTANSIQISKRHRILRRGRPFGDFLDESMEPDKMINSKVEGKRGIYFICFNANIARQFEFIQQAWLNNPKFGGLDYDVDPINGYSYYENHYSPGTFTIPDCPVRKKIINIPQFITVKGGAYFFMPGISAIKFMAVIEKKI